MKKILKGLTLYRGDCLRILPTLPPESVDLILADPPYGTTQCKWDSVIDLDEMWKALNYVIKPNGAIVLLAQSPFDKILGTSNIEQLRYEWIWEKGNATGFLNAKKMPLKAHENILVFYKKLPTYNPQMTEGHARKISKNRAFSSECYGETESPCSYDSTQRYPRSVQRFSKGPQGLNIHPTQKPIELMEYLIKTYSNENDTVLDFSMGSGTTGLACINTDRNFIGIELNKKYYKLTLKRIKKHGL